MMNNASNANKAVSDYLNSMFMDLTLAECVTGPLLETPFVQDKIEATDSIDLGQRLEPCLDLFQFMLMGKKDQLNPQHFLALLTLIQLSGKLPESRVKEYCLRQCQILLNMFVL